MNNNDKKTDSRIINAKPVLICHDLEFEDVYQAHYKFLEIFCIIMKINICNSAKHLFTLYWLHGINDETNKLFLAPQKSKFKRNIIGNQKDKLIKAKLIYKIAWNKYSIADEFKGLDIFDSSYVLNFNQLKVDEKNR